SATTVSGTRGVRSVTGRGSSREPARPPEKEAPGTTAAVGSESTPGESAGGGSAPGGSTPGTETDDDFREEIEAMSRTYPGVGQRTAERLYEAFGDEVLDVIDRDPGRIKDVLPQHRAQAVIDGRAAELERGDG
ncbi:MAG: hypothetical protein ACODAA_04600, partial [Gemmatimonadota bacterium]